MFLHISCLAAHRCTQVTQNKGRAMQTQYTNRLNSCPCIHVWCVAIKGDGFFSTQRRSGRARSSWYCTYVQKAAGHLTRISSRRAAGCVPVGVGGHAAHRAFTGARLLIGHVVMGFSPAATDDHMLGPAKQDIARLQLQCTIAEQKRRWRLRQQPWLKHQEVDNAYRVPRNGVRDPRQRECGVGRFGRFPRHAHIAWLQSAFGPPLHHCCQCKSQVPLTLIGLRWRVHWPQVPTDPHQNGHLTQAHGLIHT